MRRAVSLPEIGAYKLTVNPGETCIPVALLLYDREKNTLEFARAPGVDSQEFIALVRSLLNPYYAMTQEEADALRVERAKAVLKERKAKRAQVVVLK